MVSIAFVLFIDKTSRHNNLKTRTAMNAKIPVVVICVEVIIFLSLLHNCTFKYLHVINLMLRVKNITISFR